MDRNLNQDPVRGWYQQYARRETALRDLEQEARTAKRGLWVDASPVPPWEWRKVGAVR
jgi:micrococcal nuclease